MSDVDKIGDFDSYMTGFRRAASNALVAVNNLPKNISRDGLQITVNVNDWKEFVDKIITAHNPDAPSSE